ncbi:MAG: hypothetical protein AAGA56_22300 [Myxococcota bacterium]
MWRSEDEALLARLEEDDVLARLWKLEAGVDAPPLGPRASGLIHHLRNQPGGKAALERSSHEPELTSLRDGLRPASLRGADPTWLHHLAVYEGRLAATLDPSSPKAVSARLRSLAAWLALTEEERYLAAIGRAQLEDEGVEIALDRWRTSLRALGQQAKRGARELDGAGRQALRALQRVGEVADRAGVAATLRERVEREAARLLHEAIEEALAVVGVELAEAMARDAVATEGARLSGRLVDIGTWADREEEVERFAIDALTPLAWNVYQREAGFEGLRALVGPIAPLVDSLATRIEADPTKVAYAGPTAQMYVFRSEMAVIGSEKRAAAERAVQVCGSHRNGRLILARQLCLEVEASLERGFLAGLEKAALAAKLDRAESLYPATKRLGPLRERVERLRAWG